MIRTIEIQDTLQERVDGAIEDVKAELLRYLNVNKPEELPDLSNDLDYSGAIHEIVDGWVPVYTWEIKCTWFLHDADLEKSYDDAGVGENPRDGDGMAAIYFFLSQKISEWYTEEAEAIFATWKESQPQPDLGAPEDLK